MLVCVVSSMSLKEDVEMGFILREFWLGGALMFGVGESVKHARYI